MRFGWVLVSLIAAFASGPGCSTPDRFECGVTIRAGVARFCGGAGEVCICATRRCAKAVTGQCEGDLRYVDGAGECVEPVNVSSQHVSAGPLDSCPGIVEAQLGNTFKLGPTDLAGAQDPRYVAFGTGRVLVDWIDRYYDRVTPPADAPARIHFRVFDWEVVPQRSEEVFDTDPLAFGAARVRNAFSYAACSQDPIPGALFGHWIETPGGPRPVFLFVQADDTPTGMRVDDITDAILDPALPSQVRAFRIVENRGACHVVWVQDEDGADGPQPAHLFVRRVEGVATLGPATPLNINETSGDPEWRFRVVGEFATSPDVMTFQPLVTRDGLGGLLVAMGAVDARNADLAVFAQRTDVTTGMAVWAEHNPVVATLNATDYIGFELPYRNPIAQLGNSVVFVLVAVTGGGGGEVMYYRLDPGVGATGSQLGAAPSAPRGARGPALAGLEPDRCLGAFADWDGDLYGGLGTIWYFQGTIDGLPEDDLSDAFVAFENSAVPTIIGDEAASPADSRFFVEWVTTSGTRPRLMLKRESAELSPASGWPGEGLDFMPAGQFLEGDRGTPPPPLPAPDDGGAIVGWTNASEYAAYVGRIHGAN
jgi:hypothetical protein